MDTRLPGRSALVLALLVGVAWGLRTNNDTRTVSFSFSLLLFALHPLDARLANARWSRPISWCGTMCYSLYLVHLPFCKAVSHSLFLAGIDSSLEVRKRGRI